MLVLVSMWLLSGCVVTPIEAQDGSTPDGSAATIAIAPIAGAPGDTIFVSGAGWGANESVYVNLEQVPDEEPVQTTVAVATSDAEGRFTVSFTYPIDPIWREPGMIEVVAYSLANGAQASAAFEVLESPPPTEVPATAEPTVTPTATPAATATPGATATASGQQPTPTRTPTRQPTPRPSNVGVVTSSGLNVRSGPSTLFPVLRSISRGTEFTVLGQNNSGAWLSVRLRDGTEGWLARAYTDYTAIAPTVPSPKPPSPTPAPTPTRPPQGSGWRGEYYNNVNLIGNPKLVRNDANIDFNWGNGSPAREIDNDHFSVRWVRSFYLPAGSYRFYATADDGVRVWVNGDLIIDQWRETSAQTYSAVKRVDSGSALVRVEYFESTQSAQVRVWWEPVEQDTYPDWRGEYYANKNLNGSPAFVRNDSGINFDWGSGSPANNFRSDDFSVRWTRNQHFDGGTYRFHAVMDDGMRVYLDDQLIIDEWRNGSAREITRDIYVNHGTRRLRVEYYEDGSWAVARFWWERVSDDDDDDDFPDWRGEYWNNRDLDGDPRLVRNDRNIDFNWGSGSPDSRIENDNFSVRWTRWVDFDDARYRFYARADDGVRVWVDDDRIINEWHENDYDDTYSAEIELDGDERVRVEYFERTGGARVRVWWEKIDDDEPTATPEVIDPYADAVPSQGGAGTSVRVSGGGFPANTTVNLYLGGLVQASSAEATDAQVRASTTTDGRGNYSMEFAMPSTWPDGSAIESGRLVLLVATNDFNVEASAIFDYQASAPPPSSGNPYAQVSPSSGGAGTRVTVSGGGFPANTRVRVYLAGLVGIASDDDDMEDYASGNTDGQGNYSLSFNMPEEWPDDDDIETGKLLILVATDNFDVEASAEFDYFVDAPNPSIDVSPSSGGAGTDVRVSGSGFPANSEVNLYLGTLDTQVGGDAGDRIYASTNTDRRGNYSMAFTMPAEWPDGTPIPSDRVVIVVANSDFSVVVSSGFNYTAAATPAPTLTPTPTNTQVAGPTPTPTFTATPAPVPSANVNPGSGGAGTTVTVNGNGFPANVTVNAYLGIFGGNGTIADDAERYATTTTDGNGNYSLNFVMPERWPDGSRIEEGRVLVVIATNDFGAQASATFRYNEVSSAAAPTATATDTVEPTPSPEPTAVEEPTTPPTEEPVDESADEPAEEPVEEPIDEPEPTATPEPTNTPVPPTATPEPTATPTLEPTATQEPTATPEPTSTPVPPTNTPAPTNTPVPPTNTPVPPTNTPVPPTNTPVPEPTATLTPTATLPPVEEPQPEEESTVEQVGEPDEPSQEEPVEEEPVEEEPTEEEPVEETETPTEEPPAEGEGDQE